MRILLTTTALVALLSAGAIAQDTVAPNAGPSEMMTQGYELVDTDGLASKLLGFPVYSAASTDAEQLGEINDIVIGQDGQVAAVIVGVGGFLGIGEKNVAVDYRELQWTVAEDDTERLVLNTTREALEAAASVELIEDEPMETAAAAPAADQPMDDNAAMDTANAPAAAQPLEDDAAMDTAEPLLRLSPSRTMRPWIRPRPRRLRTRPTRPLRPARSTSRPPPLTRTR